MNERIKELARQAGFELQVNCGPLEGEGEIYYAKEFKKFAKLIAKAVLDEVSTRAFVSGDRAWSDDVDRQWVELEFGMGKLAELSNNER
jgi:hypothetical protein